MQWGIVYAAGAWGLLQGLEYVTIGHKQSLGKGHQEQTFGSTVRRPLSSQTSHALTFD